MIGRELEGLLRELAPQVLTALVRRFGQFDLCEDATQEALLAAATQWPSEGLPHNPRGWLVTVGSRRLMDLIRGEHSRRQREDAFIAATPQSELLAGEPAIDHDDSLRLLFLCCHPSLSPPSQIALTLRAVGGLSTAPIAAAFRAHPAGVVGGQGRRRRGVSRGRPAGHEPARAPPPQRPRREAGLRAVELEPHVILMDVRMPAMDGVQAVAAIKEQAPRCRVVMLTTFDDERYVVDALRAGASGYLLKDLPSSRRAAAIRLTHAGVAQLDPAAAARLAAASSRPASQTLSERELEVLRLVAAGLTNREIGRRLYLSEGTVKNHVSKVLERLGLRDRTQAAFYARDHGLI